jgi:signal transduction histidine kinase
VSELGHAFNQLARDLIQVNARLAEAATARLKSQQALEHADRLRMVGQLAAGVAHEVGTPLSVIGGRAQLIARRHSTGERDHADAGVIREQASHISELVHRLLDYARVAPPQPQPCDLRALVAETLDLLAPEGRRGRVRVVADLPEQPVLARVDPRAMRQVLVNLVLNGIQAMERAPTPPGPDAVVIVRARANVPRLRAESSGPLVEVRVIDQGPGVPEDVRPRLFEPFFTTKAPGEGTGLGLPVVDRIVAEHEGTVTVLDAPEGGAVFVVQLPALEA